MIAFCMASHPDSCCSGGGERTDRRHPVHHERTAGVPDLLAHIQHHGRQSFRWEIREMCQQDRLHPQCKPGQQQD